MTEKELVKYLKKLGVLVTFNKNLKLWQIILDEQSFYLTKSNVDSLDKEKLDEFLTLNIVKIMASGGNDKIIYH